MNIFYTPDISGYSYTLNEEESKHCIRVLRMKIGDIIHLVDGRGGFFKGQITVDSPKLCSIEIVETQSEFEKRNYILHLAIAPTKNTDRIEWLIEKAVEIGIDEFTPIICEHSERKHINIERLERIAISAMKQSVKAYLPKINEAVPFKNFIKNTDASNKFVAHCISSDDLVFEKVKVQELYKSGQSVTLLVGPEGDFSPEEVKMAIDAGYRGVTLGNSRLRTETAGLVACHTIAFLNSIDI
jgi:16S rRNA (uracil1498-N3)-methyltransferase